MELYYREQAFDISFSSPYRLQLLDDSVDQPPVYAWVKADSDRYVRKVGVRSIEDTRYQARLDAKVEELAQVYCSQELIHGMYCTLAQDHAFVDMLRSVWRIELSERLLGLYRVLVMYTHPLVRTDSGYHVPSSEEVIAEIRAFFDPAHLSPDAPAPAAGEDSYLQDLKVDITCMFQGINVPRTSLTRICYEKTVLGHLLRGMRVFLEVLSHVYPYGSTVDLLGRDSDFTVPSEVSEAVSQVSTVRDVLNMMETRYTVQIDLFLLVWLDLHACLEHPRVGTACECPFVYFFVKYCLDRSLGVPKLALALYDRMNMQLSREFIRCANPTCELNKLDESTRQVKFKKCSRCHAVIYCSRECQLAHYPDHKRLCREHSTG